MGPRGADGADHETSCIHKSIVLYIVETTSIHSTNPIAYIKWSHNVNTLEHLVCPPGCHTFLVFWLAPIILIVSALM